MYPCALANAIGIASAVPYSQGNRTQPTVTEWICVFCYRAGRCPVHHPHNCDRSAIYIVYREGSRTVKRSISEISGDVLAVPVPVTSHPPPLSVAVVQIEVNGASSLSPSLPLVCSSRFYVSRVVIVLPTEMTIGVVLYTYLSFVYLNTCLGCLAVSTIATGTFRSLSCKDSGLYGTSASVPTAAILASEPDQQPSAHVALPLSPFSVLVPSGTLNPRSPRLRITQTRVRAPGEGTSSEAWLIAARVSRGASLIKNDLPH